MVNQHNDTVIIVHNSSSGESASATDPSRPAPILSGTFVLLLHRPPQIRRHVVEASKAEGFGIPRPTSYKFERSRPVQRLYRPTDDPDLDDIAFSDEAPSYAPGKAAAEGEQAGDDVDTLDAFMADIQEQIRAPPPPPKPEAIRRADSDEDEDGPVESFLRAKKDAGLTLAADAMRAGYDSDEKVYAAAKAVDAGMMDYDSDDNPIVVDKKKIEPIPLLDHSTIEYDAFNKDFYEEKPSISGEAPEPCIPFQTFDPGQSCTCAIGC
jgi:ATP-dependent RNA helicase DDX42